MLLLTCLKLKISHHRHLHVLLPNICKYESTTNFCRSRSVHIMSPLCTGCQFISTFISSCAWQWTKWRMDWSHAYLSELCEHASADIRSRSSVCCDLVIQQNKTTFWEQHMSLLDQWPGTVCRISFATLSPWTVSNSKLCLKIFV